MKNDHCNGFTLKELIVVLVLLGVLILIGAPIYTYAGNQRFEKAMLRGMGIYKALFSGLVDLPPEQFRRYEVVGEFPQTPNSPHDPFTTVTNSNEYFVHLVTNGILSVEWSYFSGPGVQSVSG
ncbi:MAG: prepilin-type N-terminal cleavage/methylation domain-containing protein, partial [Kiritimatiellae bacterium]|nr:prepilin-type N-terminal cleavage/methylation domain-containing protein [Kiritimatiellia bacterium]